LKLFLNAALVNFNGSGPLGLTILEIKEHQNLLAIIISNQEIFGNFEAAC
jgi:hypothetical protein